jgi:hypothetical protein
MGGPQVALSRSMRPLRFAPSLVLVVASVLAGSRAGAQSAEPAAAIPVASAARPAPVASPPPAGPLATPPPVPPQVPDRSAMLVSGAVVTILGAALLAGGGALLATSRSSMSDPTYDSSSNPWPSIGSPVSVVMLIAGAVHVFVGVPLLIAGAQPPGADAPAPASVYAWALPSVAPGPRSVSLRWTF